MMVRSHRVRTSAELRALSSPERQEMVHTLFGRPPMSVRELGEAVGRLPVSLYYHLRVLERAGLVVQVGTRAAEKGEEALYALPAHEISIQPEERGRKEVTALRKIGAGVFRRAQRLHDMMVAEEPARERSERDHLLAQRTVKLDRRGLKRVHRLLSKLADELQQTPPAGGGAFYTVTLHLARDRARR